jgi:hypothetical protein
MSSLSMTMPQAICLNLVLPIQTAQHPSNSTTSLLQKLNQGVITIFYTCHTYHNILDASEKEDSLVYFSDCHKLYSVVNFTVNFDVYWSVHRRGK